MTLHLDQISADFYAASGLNADCEWARTGFARLLLDGLEPADAASALAEPLSSLCAAGAADDDSPPEHLLGTATEWAREALPELRASGVPVTGQKLLAARDVVIAWALCAGFVGLGFVLLQLFSEGWSTTLSVAKLLLLPAVTAAGFGATAAYRLGLARRGFGAALVACVATALAAGAAIFGMVWLLREPSWEASTLWHLAVPVLLLGLGFGLQRPARRVVSRAETGGAAASDPRAARPSDWYGEYATHLRLTGNYTDTEVARLVREARDHVTDSGSSPTVEFGAPESHAARMPVARGVKELRLVVLWSGVAVVLLSLCINAFATDSFSWLYIACFVLTVSVRTIPAWRAYLATRRALTLSA